MDSCKCRKLNQKLLVYIVGVFVSISLCAIIVTVAVKPSLVKVFYYFGKKVDKEAVIIYQTALVFLLCSCIFLFIGLWKESSIYVLVWLMIMTIFWNINLVCSIVTIVSLILKGLDSEVKNARVIAGISLFIQSLWLLLIAMVWCYWRKLTEIRDLPSLIDFLEKRRSSGDTATPQIALLTSRDASGAR